LCSVSQPFVISCVFVFVRLPSIWLFVVGFVSVVQRLSQALFVLRVAVIVCVSSCPVVAR